VQLLDDGRAISLRTAALSPAESGEVVEALNLMKMLTPRELEIVKYLPTGLLNKQIAGELNIAEQTVKIHRRNICDKLGVKSVPEIIRITEKAGVIILK
jgi:DNA-binding NarL/FixJ family response regulator